MSEVIIKAKSMFRPELSNVDESSYCFEYEITIKNESNKKIKLLSRHWNIHNGFGELKEIDGEGVIGQKPTINPGENFIYKSYCPLNTKFGIMEGFYTLSDESGNLFKIKIPEFPLVLPDDIN